MLSRNKIKLIHSLALKKHRDEEGLFVAEGPKLVGELLKAFTCQYIAVEEGAQLSLPACDAETDIVKHDELQRATLLTTPHQVLAIFYKPRPESAADLAATARRELCLALDNIQDPGNLGTIVRTADWFGIRNIFCSPQTADIFAPKALQATMGSAARVKLHYTPLPPLLKSCGAEVWGTFLNGENINEAPLKQNGIIVIGNEGNGITPEVEAAVTSRLYIPPYPSGKPTAESLNAAVAAAVTMAAFRRRQ